jgi:protein-tyrosine phosphatase
LQIVTETLKAGGRAFIHCFGGVGRTGMGLAAIKIHLDSMTPEQALTFTKKYCGGPETKTQINFIKNIINDG